MQDGGVGGVGPLPGGDVGVLVVVAEGFAVGGLVFFAEVSAAAFVAVVGVDSDEFAEFEEVGYSVGFIQFGIEFVDFAGDEDVFPEFFAEGADVFGCLEEAFGGTADAGVVPHDFTELAVEIFDGLVALDGEEFFEALAGALFGFVEGGMVGIGLWDAYFIGEVVGDGVGDDEESVGEPLHEGGGAKAVRAVVGEVALAEGKQAWDVGLQFVIHPEPPQGVVDGGVDGHGLLVGVDAGDFFIHLEEVAVFGFDDFFAQLADGVWIGVGDAAQGCFGFAVADNGVFEVEEDGSARSVDAASFVAHFFYGACGHVARNEVSEGGVHTFEEVISIFGWNVARILLFVAYGEDIVHFFGHPDASVIAEGFGHEGELRLVFAAFGDTGGVDLDEAGVGHQGTAAHCFPSCGDVGAHGIGG